MDVAASDTLFVSGIASLGARALHSDVAASEEIA
jgi:hypothetical protein